MLTEYLSRSIGPKEVHSQRESKSGIESFVCKAFDKPAKCNEMALILRKLHGIEVKLETKKAFPRSGNDFKVPLRPFHQSKNYLVDRKSLFRCKKAVLCLVSCFAKKQTIITVFQDVLGHWRINTTLTSLEEASGGWP